MALTSTQLVALREYLGYSVSGDAQFYGSRELVYSDVSYLGLSLETRLANLSSDEENRLTTYYLPNLAAREQDIQDATSNLDVSEAGNVKFNPREILQRTSAFNDLRRRLCTFLGFAPGEGIPDTSRVGRF